MTSFYNEIYSHFFHKCTDYSFLELDEKTMGNLMNEWMRSSLAHPYIRKLFKNIKFDDEMKILSYTLKNSIDEESDSNFACEIISQAMIIEWLEPQVKNIVNISQMFGGKEEKFYSQSAHMAQLQSMLSDTKKEIRKTIRDYGYINNSYINKK